MEESFIAYKNKIGERVTRTIADALAQGSINEEQAAEMAEYIIEQIEVPQNNIQLLDFLTNLAVKWALFDGILTLELGEATEQKDHVVAQQAENLLKQNKVEEAIQVLKDATQPGGGQNA